MKPKAGTIRRTNKNIGVSVDQIRTDLQNLLEDAKYWTAHKTYEPDELATRFHHRLTQIHPFPNGNGRQARTPHGGCSSLQPRAASFLVG